MLDYFTHRERNVLIVFLLGFIFILIGTITGRITQDTLEAWAIPVVLFYVLPIGIYLVGDQERMERVK